MKGAKHQMSETPPVPAPIRMNSSLSRLAVKLHFDRHNDLAEITRGAVATGFVWRRDKRHFLITNLHNVTGWDYARGRALSDVKGTRPNHVATDLRFSWGAERPPFRVASLQMRWHLYDPEDVPLWLVHPTFGDRVDVVALQLDIDAEDAFVLGFPEGLDGGVGFPVWKRASIASEPYVDLDGLPKLYIDTATRRGMSGSCVVARRNFAWPEGGDVRNAAFGEIFQFLGVYSGRVGEQDVAAQLGIVWKGSVIDQIIDGNCRGATPEERHGQRRAAES